MPLVRDATETDFRRLVDEHRGELHAHCYRMLGSLHDAEDALQETLLRAWRGLPGFGGRSSLRTWLYTIATNVCMDALARRSKRVLPIDYGPPSAPTKGVGEPLVESVWVEPYPDEALGLPDGPASPDARYEQREAVELAFVAALQHLPGTQRAVLILREVLGYSAAEVARILDTTPASVNSAMQRARKTVGKRVPDTTQQAELTAIGSNGQRQLVDTFVGAWERADVSALLDLLAEDARFTMPPLPAWFRGREDVGRFFADRVFATPWRLVPLRMNGQLALACYILEPGADRFRLGAINVLSLRAGRIVEIAGFLDPDLHRHLGLPADLPDGDPPP